MFAGIVQRLAPVFSVTKTHAKSVSIKLDLGKFGERVGGSVSVNGVCLTITRKHEGLVTWMSLRKHCALRI